jgi:L-cysteine desulfidase
MTITLLETLLRKDVKPALGCTEPVTIALAACHAARQAGGDVQSLDVRLSTNLLKNAMEVGIPGTQGEHGIPLAAALGCLSPATALDLKLLEGIDPDWLNRARSLVSSGRITLALEPGRPGLFVDARAVSTTEGRGRAVIAGSHEHLVRLEKNDQVVLEQEERGPTGGNELLHLRGQVAELPFRDLFAALPQMSAATADFLHEGVAMNRRVAEAGLDSAGSLRVGRAFEALMHHGRLGRDVMNEAKKLTSAAVDARMSGCNLPVMTSAGSGNQGLTITLPLAVLAEQERVPPRRLAESLALAHLITSILKHHSGTLSAMCGCVVCSGTGLTTGVIYLLGGGPDLITAAVNNMVGGITGIICDGAKVGCAVKLVCAVDAAFQAAFLAQQGVVIPPTNGVLGRTLEESLRNIGRIAAPGMLETDEQILEIMVGKPG